MPRMFTVAFFSGSKNPVMALEMELTCVNVPIQNRPTHMPKNANTFASQRHFMPMPRSM